ncbi:MAG: DNA-directed RNA polymerase subunit alpha [Deferribacterota bacterium]|nr:DNA-directed RNA polymerase subunit alpha [Deferribacterota bacterium]
MDFRQIIKPNEIIIEKDDNIEGVFRIEPLEKGFGITIGNSLRRILLSSIEGTAVFAIKIKGVTNEFAVIPGVLEDVVNIILNVKSLSLNLNTHETKRYAIKKKGEGLVKAKDIQADALLEIIDPEQLIATITDDNDELDMEIFVKRGIGYVPSEEISKLVNNEIDVIPIDAIFTPIKKVSYNIESARVGQSTDYDSLIINIETDGTVKPIDALAYGAKILKDHMELFINFEEPKYEEKEEAGDEIKKELVELLDKSIEELELSVRAYNCLKNAGIKTLAELCGKTEADMLRTKNFGRKSLEEIKNVLYDLGLTLGMDLESIGYYAQRGDKDEAS